MLVYKLYLCCFQWKGKLKKMYLTKKKQGKFLTPNVRVFRRCVLDMSVFSSDILTHKMVSSFVYCPGRKKKSTWVFLLFCNRSSFKKISNPNFQKNVTFRKKNMSAGAILIHLTKRTEKLYPFVYLWLNENLICRNYDPILLYH